MDREAGRREKKGAYRSPVRVGTVLLAAGVAVAMIQYKVPTILSSLMALFDMDAEAASWLMSIFTLASVFAALRAPGRRPRRRRLQKAVLRPDDPAVAPRGDFGGCC